MEKQDSDFIWDRGFAIMQMARIASDTIEQLRKSEDPNFQSDRLDWLMEEISSAAMAVMDTAHPPDKVDPGN